MMALPHSATTSVLARGPRSASRPRPSSQPGLPRRGRGGRRRPAGAADPGLPGRRRLARPDDALAAPDRPPHPQGRDARRTWTAPSAASSGSRSGWSASPSATASAWRSSARAAAATSRRCSPSRRPDLVSGIVTLGSPQLDPLAVHPFVRAQVVAVGTLGTLGAARLLQALVPHGQVLRALLGGPRAPLPARTSATVGLLAQRRHRGLARLSRPGAPSSVEIRASHVGMAVDPAAYAAIARRSSASARRPGAGRAAEQRAGRAARARRAACAAWRASPPASAVGCAFAQLDDASSSPGSPRRRR